MATPRRQAALYKEGRIKLAIQSYKQGLFRSYRAAAKAYDVPRTTLKRRLNGIPAQPDSNSKKRLLTPTKEESLIKWILSRDRRGMPPRSATVRQMACLLIAEHGKPGYIGKIWVHNFISRNPTLKCQYNRKYDYQRAKCEDPELIRGWFQRV